jgi:hypothetical protein
LQKVSKRKEFFMRKANKTVLVGTLLLFFSTFCTVSIMRYIVSDAQSAWAEKKKVIDAGTLIRDASVDAARIQNAPPPTDPEDMGAIIKSIYEAVKQGKWAWLVGLACMLLTLLVNRVFSWRIPPKVLPWISIALGVISASAFALAEGQSWLAAIGQGMTVGMAGAGGWSALGRHMFNVGPPRPSSVQFKDPFNP